MPTKAVQFGVIGIGRIARNAFIPALSASHLAELAAAGSRDLARAEACHPRRAYASYEGVLEDPEIDAVYIATHNGLHAPLTIAALEHGKHVLCEKPLAPTAAECAMMLSAARRHDRHLVEAFMYRHHPRIAAAQRLVGEGTIGDLRVVEASFSFHMTQTDDVRWNAAWGGGGAYDVGCYCVNAARCFFRAQPHTVNARGRFHPTHDVDTSLHGVLEFSDGRFAIISCGMDAGFRNDVRLCGTEGTISLPDAFANNHQPTQLILTAQGETTTRDFAPCDVYRAQIEDLATAIQTDRAPRLPPTDGRDNTLVLEALLTSARANGASHAIRPTA